MKNIWKLLMVAMMAIAMVGCPQPKDDDNDDNNSSGVSSTGVFTITGRIDKISSAWGGSSAAPSFSVMLLDPIAADSIKDGTITDFKQLPVDSPCYQISNGPNITFFTSADGTWKSNYAPVAAKITGETYTLYVNKNTLNKNVLKGLGQDFGTLGEGVVEEDPDLSDYNPYIIGLWGDDMSTDASFGGYCWSAAIYKMTDGATFPTDAVNAPAEVQFSIKVTGKVVTNPETDASEDAEWTIHGVKWFEGYKVPINFYGSGTTESAENAAANTVLTATLANLTPATWEMSNTGDNTWPASIAGSTYAKKVKVGAYEHWVGFTALTDSFNVDPEHYTAPGNGGSSDPVNAATPTFTTNLSTETVNYSIAGGAEAPVLTVVAAVTDDGTLSYQWQKKAEGDENFADIDGATVASYTPVVTATGTTQYKVIVTNTNNDATGEKTATATSAIATVTVTE